MTETNSKTQLEYVKLAVIDIEDQVVVAVDPNPPPGKQLFKTKNKTGSPVVYHFLWRLSTDMAFKVDDTIDHYQDPKLHKDNANQATDTAGQVYHALTAPFVHSSVED